MGSKGGAVQVASPSEQDWRAESDHRTLTDAAEIQSDKSRMAGAKKHHKKSLKKTAMVSKLFGGRR